MPLKIVRNDITKKSTAALHKRPAKRTKMMSKSTRLNVARQATNFGFTPSIIVSVPLLDRSGSMSGLEKDTIGGAIHHIGNVHKYTAEHVKQMIERQKQKYSWEFIFLGANIDAAGVSP